MSKQRLLINLLVVSVGVVSLAHAGMDHVARLRIPQVEIVCVENITDGRLEAAESVLGNETSLAPFVRVVAVAKPSAESRINIEVWLPNENWNGKLLGTGNGGAAGVIRYQGLVGGLGRGYAVVNCDLGTAPTADVQGSYPERWIDFGHRATHEMTVVAKKVVAAYYGSPAQRAYFIGASTGGQQALMEAQRYPDDYDGIIAGAPANNRTSLHAMFVWNWQVLRRIRDEAFTCEEINLVTQAVIKAGAGKDGGAPSDNFLTDPRQFLLEAKLFENVLSLEKVAALRQIYAGAINLRSQQQIYPGPPVGSESTMHLGSLNEFPPHSYLLRWALGVGFDFEKFDFDRDLEHTRARLAHALDANDPDLRHFAENGGKILMYAGTADAITPFQATADYYERVVAANGGWEETKSFFRFFVVPGLAHVIGGPGPNQFGQTLEDNLPRDRERDILMALESWVEDGRATDRLIVSSVVGDGSAPKVQRQRPVYPYPYFPHYVGGDPDQVESYAPMMHRTRPTFDR
ncbi:tannase/feruloyl esterase family alpha/beta hydrolase [Oleiharenicola lentus]|uniref:tannase/feruloyl esterase family alpha/beta hydrolase n=1 Tax=Oleiharenicola lentus TaxID=2508720 RepID=UPI003F67AC68